MDLAKNSSTYVLEIFNFIFPGPIIQVWYMQNSNFVRVGDYTMKVIF